MKEKHEHTSKQKDRTRVKSIQELARLADIESNRSVAQEFPFETEVNEEDTEAINIIKDVQNPELSYKLFYATQGLMKQFLPKGKKYKGLREYTYELKNILLTQGKMKDENGKRGLDSRQAYIAGELKVMYDLITDWVKNGAMAVYLIERLQKLNEERGYNYPGNPKRREE